VKVLLKHGANPNAKTIHSRTALHLACISGELLLCEILLNAGASVNSQDFEKNTPVHYASLNSNPFIKL
jgi:ankyrin repeat protein